MEGLKKGQKELQYLLKEYEMYMEQLEEIKFETGNLLMQVPNAKEILEIKGIGLVTATGIIAEIGDISRFEDARQI